MKIAIKSSAKKRVIAFGKAAKPLGELSEQELAELALIVRESGRKDYEELFEDLPTLSQLQKGKVDAALAPTPGIATPEQAEAVPVATPETVGLVEAPAPKKEAEPTKKKK